VVFHFFCIPTTANAEEHAPARQVIEARDFLGQRDRITLDDEADAGAEPQLRGHRRRHGERDERIVTVPVLLGQRTAAGPRALAAGGDVRVLGNPQRFEAAGLDGAGELVGTDRVVGRKHHHAVLHRGLLRSG
jgi:hypothetical protein